ncbi:hypothetical protein LTR84_007785 [Exophiala bonariae]|uniref:Major facilitator superfamily (MFS) profile domain-containing protein n=1 Tax=Exophiala bonariae TaxID=1690606 RepID=A0AAV9NM44_9EURO|nr:hypothetical protein LTR84_007785 [Exophiala bonariae]
MPSNRTHESSGQRKSQQPDMQQTTAVHLEESKAATQDINEEDLAAAHTFVEVNTTLASQIIRKTDMHLLPLCVVINIFNFIDRSNIGNARLLGMQHDLQLSGNKYNIAVMCIFISGSAVEIPANIICKKIGTKVWLPMIVFTFGLITTLMSLTHTAEGLYIARFFLGIPEGGVSPAIIWLLSQFYRRAEMGLRTSIYISAAASSGAFGGLLAIGLSKIPRWGLIHTWRNIYFFEGLVSIAIGIIAFRVIPNGPDDARFLSQEERQTALNRLQVDAAGTNEGGKTKWKHIKQALTSPHVLGSGLGLLLGK